MFLVCNVHNCTQSEDSRRAAVEELLTASLLMCEMCSTFPLTD